MLRYRDHHVVILETVLEGHGCQLADHRELDEVSVEHVRGWAGLESCYFG